MKCKKRVLNREIVTLGGQKKQETAMIRKFKRKMNQQRGQAGFPASRKANSLRPLQDNPISVVFVDNTKGGKLAKIFKEEEKRLGNMTGYNVREWHCPDYFLAQIPGKPETVAEKIAKSATKGMRSSKISRK